MKNVRMTICLIVAVLFLSAASFGGTYNGGNGTETEPYQINNITDWQELMTTPDDWNQHFILTADVNLAGIALTPVGNSSTQFTGVFDGNDNIISSGIGLFGYVGSGGQIRNLGVENANILGIFHIGGLVGRNYGTLTACYATGLVSGEFGVGGLVGVNYGTLTACYATGSVRGENEVGGLVGLNYGTLTACYATGSVSGKSHTPSRYAGGLVGYNYGTLTACYATGSVSGITDGYAGGLVGYNEGMLTSCYATVSVTGNSGVGGLVGENSGAITSCYATGSVTGSVL
ncbi:MAG: peptidase A26, partial [Planctomycetota bacterium]|nr:peptidase A26 [Planctomycetota bacterium]